jgi:hypothetical protein
LSRQRISSSLSLNSIEITLANRILRKIHDSAIEQKVMQIYLRLPLKLAVHLLNVKRQRITQMEMDYGIRISITPDTLLGAEEIPEMEVTLKGQGGGETRTSVPISASDMRDDKPGKKRGRDKKELDKKNDSVTTISSREKKIADEQVKSTEKSAKSLLINEEAKSIKESSLKEELPETTAEAKNKTEDSAVKVKQNTDEVDKKQTEISKLSKDKAEETVVLFKSSHETIKTQDSPNNIISTPEIIAENNEVTEITTYTSVHLEDQHNLKDKNEIHPVIKTVKEKTVETPMFSSVHLGDAEKIAAQLNAKQDAESHKTAVKTTPVPRKKPIKSVPRKSTVKTPVAKKTESSKVAAKVLPNKTKVESAEKPGAKSKSVQIKVSTAKKDSVKSTAPKPAEKDKNSPAKSAKATKAKPKANSPQQQQKKPATPTAKPKAEESAT